MFTGLSADNYAYVIRDDHNCEETGTVVVGNVNTFTPSISPDIIIEPGGSTDLTVVGGVTWSWYEGATFVGSSETITVMPAETTTYVCNVTDDEGCEAVLEVTVFIDDGSGLEGFALGKSLTMYPNPSNGSFDIAFSLIEARPLSLSIVNVLGDQVLVQSHPSIKDQTLAFDLSGVASGVYFVVLQSADETVTKKMIIR